MGFEDLEMLVIAVVLVIVAVSYFAGKLGVAAPILLVVIGIGLSLIPGLPPIAPEPELILTVVLPPLLYSAAVNMPVVDFRRDFGTIGALSVVLVLVSAFGIGLLLWWIFPDLHLAAAIAVGAIVSPPDAVAATAIGKKLGLPPRLLTVLEGEGLVNDATALVLLRTAVAATAGTFSFWHAVGDFAYAVVIAIAAGVVIGAVSVWIRSSIQQPALSTAISFAVPFLAFLPAEALNASGVIAVVVAGLITGAGSARKHSVQDRSSERTNWLTVQMLLENGVFLLMGLQLMTLVGDVEDVGLSVWIAVWVGLLVTVALGVVRVGFVVPLMFGIRRRQRRSREKVELFGDMLERVADDERWQQHPRGPRIQRHLRRQHADARFYANEGIGWRGGAVIAWSGMRGVVTLAAAQSLPTDFPYRTQLMLIAFVVAIVTLVGQGGTLPLLIRVLGIRGTDEEHAKRELRLLLTELNEAAAKQVIDNPDLRRRDGTRFDDGVLERARKMREQFTDPDRAEARDSTMQQVRELEALILEAEQDALGEARSTGAFSSHTIERAQRRIDSGAMRLEHD
ncbi:MAG TPA: sodium:proton antiporter [Candidatus Agrococcus pullicola]|uniref:Sodium:proton antiporter n=1 Tax=Candidatus Agrococcus pullicola TaxID=2838429 RepID=A0A9D1YX74_9MICO|nr:sodium:proton antiporter [Candidatus Agrococcus pullicola]